VGDGCGGGWGGGGTGVDVNGLDADSVKCAATVCAAAVKATLGSDVAGGWGTGRLHASAASSKPVNATEKRLIFIISHPPDRFEGYFT
jgi:hypothetical protein